MNLLEYYASLRKELLFSITGINDAGCSLFRDDTASNFVTGKRLEEIHEQYLIRAQVFGLYVVTRHTNCPNPRHEEHIVDNRYGLSIVYNDSKYIWEGRQMYQGERYCKCPCSNNNDISNHWVIDDVCYDKNADYDICRALESILDDLVIAIAKAGGRKPRSAIREYLLRAVIKIDDEILPVSMNEYIEHQLNLTRNQNNA